MLGEFLAKQPSEECTYDRVGGTRDYRTKEEFKKDSRYIGYDVDYYRVFLGKGEEVYDKAIDALRKWKQFEIDWVQSLSRFQIKLFRLNVVTQMLL